MKETVWESADWLVQAVEERKRKRKRKRMREGRVTGYSFGW
jgi:hypothetical protein